MMEIALMIDTGFASYLPVGSMSLMYYAHRFLAVPLGIFPIAFSTILLPHLSRVSTYAPKRLGFYVLESSKFVFWATMPVALLMGVCADQIFLTLFVSEKFTIAHAYEAGALLRIFSAGLFFFSLNKILLNVFYARHITWIPALVSVVSSCINLAGNFLLIGRFGAYGLVTSTVLGGIAQTIMYFILLHYVLGLRVYIPRLLIFAGKYLMQLSAIGIAGYGIFCTVKALLERSSITVLQHLLTGVGFWMWVTPLCCVLMVAVWYARSYNRIRLYFLDE
jgi:putative peptidoglycan lipid II flippase